MINEENTPDLEQEETNTQEEESESTTEETQEEEHDLEYWKKEALKNKAILERNKNKPAKKSTPEPDGLDLGMKGYLKASGIKANEFDFVEAELKKSGGDIDDLLDNEYFQAKLEKHRALSKTQEATPKGKRSSGVATDSVEYWSSKPIADVPVEMRRAVVNAKLAKEQSQGKFYNS